MSNKQCIQRLLREYKAIQKDPPPYITARPDEENVQVWWYVITGPPDSPYAGGSYLGKVRFPDEYPFAPPSIMMCTPSGRFKPDSRLCFSMTDFHPKEWNPSWGPSSILKGLLSFMLEDTQTYGSVETSTEYKTKVALESHAFNLKHPAFLRMFPAEKADCEASVAAQQQKQGSSSSSSSTTTPTAAATAAGAGGEASTTKENASPAAGGDEKKGAEEVAKDGGAVAVAAPATVTVTTTTTTKGIFGVQNSTVLKCLQIVFVLLVAVAMMYAAQKSGRKRVTA